MTVEQIEKTAWLNRAFYAEKKLKALKHLCDRDRERTQQITAALGGNIKGKSDSRKNNVELALLKLAESEEKYRTFLEEYMKIREEIENAISSLEDNELEAIFIYRHLNFMSIEKIAETMYYDERTIRRKYLQGLQEIEKMSANVR